jgi:DNA mismatch repair protein MSH4
MNIHVLIITTEEHQMQTEIRYDNLRRYWLRISESHFENGGIPDVLVNRIRKKGYIECQTLTLMKLNQKIEDSHHEVRLLIS